MIDGAPVALLLHGFGGAGRSWSQVQALLKVGSVAPDLPGFGAEPPLCELSLATYAGFVVERMQAIARPVVLVGASMGGKIAMAAAAHAPSQVCALVLCAPSPPTPEPIDAEERRRQLGAWRDREAGMRSVRDGFAKTPPNAVLEAALEDWLAVDETTWRWWWESGSRETIDVSSVRASTSVLGGEADDRLGATAQAQLTVPKFSHAQLTLVPGAGHMLAIDDPAAVARAITSAAAGC